MRSRVLSRTPQWFVVFAIASCGLSTPAIAQSVTSPVARWRSNNLSLRSTPVIIVNDSRFCSQPGLARFQDDVLFLTYRCGSTDTSYDGSLYSRYSTDGGNTWSPELTLLSAAGVDYREPDLTMLHSGQIMMSYFRRIPGLYALPYVMTGTPNPDNTVTWGHPVAVRHQFSTWAAHASPVLELANGTLALPIYGKLHDGDPLDSAAVVFSIDGGMTWGGQVTIAATNGIKEYNEANVVQLRNGRIVAMIRHDVGATGYACSYSDDNGATWSFPRNVIPSEWVGKPALLLLGSGGIFLQMRYGSSLSAYSASWNGGASWENPATLNSGGDQYSSMTLRLSGSVASVTSTPSGPTSAKLQYQEFYDVHSPDLRR